MSKSYEKKKLVLGRRYIHPLLANQLGESAKLESGCLTSLRAPRNLVGGPRYMAIVVCGLKKVVISFLKKALEALWRFSETPLFVTVSVRFMRITSNSLWVLTY
jgi:hypothetical protein